MMMIRFVNCHHQVWMNFACYMGKIDKICQMTPPFLCIVLFRIELNTIKLINSMLSKCFYFARPFNQAELFGGCGSGLTLKLLLQLNKKVNFLLLNSGQQCFDLANRLRRI